MPSAMRPPSATNSLASYDSNGSTIPSAPPRTLENHVKTTAGDMKIVGREKCLPAVIVPLIGNGGVKVGVLGADSFAVGQALTEDSSRMLKFKKRWAPFMGFDDNAIMDVHLWRHPATRHPPPLEERPMTPPRTKAKQRERGPLEDPMKLLGGSLNSSTIASGEGLIENPFKVSGSASRRTSSVIVSQSGDLLSIVIPK